MSDSRIKIGLIGCGMISGLYLKMLKVFDNVEVVACADIDPKAAKARAAEFAVPRACSVKKLLADPDIAIVLNLTIPKVHGKIALAALKAGKSVYSEKPLAVKRSEGRKMIELASAKRLRIGCAPDTFLGAGGQTCRKLIDEGRIGEPVAATAFMMSHGMETWHPNPEFYYQAGGGPLFDMGPYYVTALVNLIGPIRRVTAMTRTTFPQRFVTSQPRAGQVINVETPTHIAGIMEFANGAIGTFTTSFDVWGGRTLPWIEIYGTKGSLSVPDPNSFGGEVRILSAGETEWTSVPHSHPYGTQFRGLGVADMAKGIQAGRPHRASGEMAFHVLDVIQSFLDSGVKGRSLTLTTTCARPAPLPVGLVEGKLD